DKASIFDQKVQEIAQQYDGKLSFRYTGPWPPYNFVTIRLQLERSAVV
ncbi:MAG: GvpL/GvpF family gas vesicle protein, partial [Chloroflexi bacterium]|nr:GvpL/GvpF family gas vesicle protein [Chloroflexota bacterium]